MDNVHYGIGAGIIGEFDQPKEEKDFLKFIRQIFNAKGIRHTELRGKLIKKVAVCGGAGSFLIKKAVQTGADAYITADVKYDEFFDAEAKLVLVDIGHYESEQFTIDLIHGLLAEKFPTFAVLKTRINTNPVRYFT
jgi:putative NIF3 family GTP cyclohydrolase 1 type 2